MSLPTWGWDSLVGTTGGRLWLGRFLTTIKPRWTMRDQLQTDSSASEGDGTCKLGIRAVGFCLGGVLSRSFG